MMAGTGVNISGAGMLRTRRKDISIKPNRRLDRKSSRGMIYENEELRLRTIHINAAIEQGQNDIKKLRKENEQLRREIWCLRDEYDKLEEILRKQKSHDGSDECESRSEENASQLSNSEKDEEDINNDFFDDVDADNDDNENLCNNDDDKDICNEKKSDDDDDDDDDDDTDENNDDNDEDNDNENNEDVNNTENRNCKLNKRETSKINNDQNQINQLKYSEIQKTEKPKESEKTNNLDHLQVDFDGLSIVDEEEEQKKIKILSNEDLTNCSINSRLSFFSSPIFTPCPFIFPNPDHVIPTTSSQVFDSTSPLKLDTQVAVKLDTPLPESRNSKFPKLPKASVTFENSSPTTIYLESPRFFTKTNQTENQIGKVENFNSNDTQIGMSPLNARPKQIFAPLKFESKGIFFAKQSPRIELFPKQSTGNEFFPNHSSRNEIFPKQSLENEIFSRQLSRNGIIMNQLSENEILQECQDNQSNDKIVSNIVINELNYPTFKEFNSRKKKSISLENLPADKTQHFTNESMNNCKLFSSCRNLNTKFSQFSQERETMDFFPNCQSPKECYNNSRDNYDPSKPFKSQLSVVLKSPCSNNIPKETPEIKLLTKNCKSLNNLHFQNGEISAFNKNFPLLNEDDKERYHEYQATSFEGPLPITLQIPSMMPIEMDYKNVPFLSRRFYYPGEEMKFFYDSIPQKISAHTQTLDEDIPLECTRSKKDLRIKNESQPKESALNRSRKKTTKKENFERKPTVDRKKRDILKKQVSISSCEESESQNAIAGTNFEIRENKHESRSSSSDVDSQKKEQTHRVSIYFNSKKKTIPNVNEKYSEYGQFQK